MRYKGFSLVVLVITIIVILVLAGVIVLSLSRNNPINSANEATFRLNIQAYVHDLNLYIQSQYLSLGSFDSNTINAYTSAEMSTYIPSISVDDTKKFRLVNGKLAYIGSNSIELAVAKEYGLSLEVTYVKDGMVLWYDGLYNGGIGIHNDNSSTNKTTWYDLSGNSNNGTLSGSFTYTASNGWGDKYLNFGAINSYVLPSTSMKYATVQIVYFTTSTGWNYLIDARSVMTSGWIAMTGVGAYTFYLDGYNLWSSVPPQNKLSYLTGICTTLDGVLPTIGARFTQNESIRGNIYCVRIYNRVLTAAEINRNYEIDKARFY